MDCIEIDDEGPQQPPPERALWCAVLATFAEDISIALAALRKARDEENLILSACVMAQIDNILNELVDPHCEMMCDLACIDYATFADRLIARIKEGIA